MNQRENIRPSGLSKSLSRTKFLKKQKSISNTNNQYSFNDHKKSKSLYLKSKNNKSCFISKNWNRQSIQSAPNYSYLSQTPKISPDKINQTTLINRFRAIQQISPLMSINPLKQKILAEEVKRSMQYKSMQVSKLLADLHHFFLSIQEVKWILHSAHKLMIKYNFKISNFYHQYFKVYNRKDQIQSLVKEAEQLLARFNQLGSAQINKNKFSFLNSNKHQYSNFQFAKIQNFIKENNVQKLFQNETNSKTGKPSLPSPLEDKQSIYKFLQDLKKQKESHQDPLKHDFKTKTFNATQQNSPYKNKTLSQLIKLSEMRKTSQSKKYCEHQDEKENINFLNYVQKNLQQQKNNFEQQKNSLTFNKNKKISINDLTKMEEFQTPINNPFQGISIESIQNKKNKEQRVKQYQMMIQNLKKEIFQLRTKLQGQNYSSQILRILQQQKEQLECQNKLLIQQNQHIKNQYGNYQIYTKRIVQKTINLLAKITNQNKKNQDENISERQYQLSSNRSSSSYRMSKYYYHQILKVLQYITKLNQNVSNFDIIPVDQQEMKDKKYHMQRELIQIQYQISELRTVKQQLNNWIQQHKRLLIQEKIRYKDFNLVDQNVFRMLYVQSKTMDQMLGQVEN